MSNALAPVKGFVRNAWYAAAVSGEIGRNLFSRRILDEPVLMYRKQDGMPVALLNRCPHKLAPLSLGTLVDDVVQCRYHGLQFDGAGACVRVPGQENIPRSARVRSFPVTERYGLLWVWMGEPSLADPTRIVAVERYGTPGWAVIEGHYQHHGSSYVNIAENLMDPAHTTFVHEKTIGNPAASEVAVQVEEGTDYVLAYRWVNNVPPPPIDRKLGGFSGLVDRCQYYYFFPPAVSRVDVVTMEAGREHSEENKDRGVRAFSYKFLTPETQNRTHFFWLHVRNFRVGEPEAAEELARSMGATFEEDNALYSAVQLEQEATGHVQYTGLLIDRAPALIRRKIKSMIEKEQTCLKAS